MNGASRIEVLDDRLEQLSDKVSALVDRIDRLERQLECAATDESVRDLQGRIYDLERLVNR